MNLENSMANEQPFHEWFDQELERRNLSRADFAQQVKVSAPTVSRWATGQRVPDEFQCERIALALGTDLGVVLEHAGHREFRADRTAELRREIAALRSERIALQDRLDEVKRTLDQKEVELMRLIRWNTDDLSQLRHRLRTVVLDVDIHENTKAQLWEQMEQEIQEVLAQNSQVVGTSWSAPEQVARSKDVIQYNATVEMEKE